MDEEEFKKLFGKRIRQLRKSKNMTQEQLAEKVWIDTQHLCKMENGSHFPSLKNLLKLSKELEVNVIDLFNYEEPIENKLSRQINYNIQHKLTQKEIKFVEKTIASLIELRAI